MKAAPVVTAAIATLATAGALIWARRRFLLVTVVGNSMSPTYHDGQRLLVRRGRYAAGDVVMFRAPDTVRFDVAWLVKRAVALAGDPVPPDMTASVGAATVPPGHLVVRSDAAGGLDSRRLGFIDSHDVIGAVTWNGP